MGRWQALTIDDMRHLDAAFVRTREDFTKLRKWQRDNNVSCAQCDEIEAKMEATRVKNSWRVKLYWRERRLNRG